MSSRVRSLFELFLKFLVSNQIGVSFLADGDRNALLCIE